MIGAFARKLGAPRAARPHDHDQMLSESAGDAPPERFVERLPHEGGDVIVAPLVEALRHVLRSKASSAPASPDASAPTLPPSPEKPQVSSTEARQP